MALRFTGWCDGVLLVRPWMVMKSAPAASTVLMKSLVWRRSLWMRIFTETVFLSAYPRDAGGL